MMKEQLNCIQLGVVQWFDVFILGLLLGGILVLIARTVNQWLEVRTLNKAKELDIILGKELLDIQKRLSKPE